MSGEWLDIAELKPTATQPVVETKLHRPAFPNMPKPTAAHPVVDTKLCGTALPNQQELVHASACWGAHCCSTARFCTPGFKPQGGRFRSKFCDRCLGHGLTVPWDLVWVLTPSLEKVLKNGKGIGFWSSAGSLDYRIVNNVRGMSPALVIFRTPPPWDASQPDTWVTLPDAWLVDGAVRLLVSRGTLIPTVSEFRMRGMMHTEKSDDDSSSTNSSSSTRRPMLKRPCGMDANCGSKISMSCAQMTGGVKEEPIMGNDPTLGRGLTCEHEAVEKQHPSGYGHVAMRPMRPAAGGCWTGAMWAQEEVMQPADAAPATDPALSSLAWLYESIIGTISSLTTSTPLSPNEQQTLEKVTTDASTALAHVNQWRCTGVATASESCAAVSPCSCAAGTSASSTPPPCVPVSPASHQPVAFPLCVPRDTYASSTQYGWQLNMEPDAIHVETPSPCGASPPSSPPDVIPYHTSDAAYSTECSDCEAGTLSSRFTKANDGGLLGRNSRRLITQQGLLTVFGFFYLIMIVMLFAYGWVQTM